MWSWKQHWNSFVIIGIRNTMGRFSCALYSCTKIFKRHMKSTPLSVRKKLYNDIIRPHNSILKWSWIFFVKQFPLLYIERGIVSFIFFFILADSSVELKTKAITDYILRFILPPKHRADKKPSKKIGLDWNRSVSKTATYCLFTLSYYIFKYHY